MSTTTPRLTNYRRFLKIEDRRTGQLVPFEPNSVQRRIRAEIVSQVQAGKPVRMIILKSRRMGVSTIIQATFAHYAFATACRFRAVTGAHLDDSSAYLHGMVEQMYDALPAPLQKRKQTGIRGKHLAFKDGSSLKTFTAGSGAGVGRGTGTRAIHGSEVAFWGSEASGTLLALRQLVPEERDTFVILESTANGVGDAFHQEWQRAVAGASDYTPLFFAWHEFEDYTRPIEVSMGGSGGCPDSDVSGKHQDAAQTGVGTRSPLGALDDDELELRRRGVTDEQLNWRRFTIENNCGGSLSMFHQEYPATPEEAFLSSGRPYFENLTRFDPVAPKYVGDIAGTPVRNGKITFVKANAGPITLWEAPKAGRKYVLGADIAGSTILTDYNERIRNDRPGEDAYCAYVADVETGRVVASLYGRGWDESQYALKLAQLGALFGYAEIAPEKNGGYGTSTILYLRDKYAYPHVFVQLDEDSTQTMDETGSYGFPMTSTTRPVVLAALSEALRDRPGALRDAGLKSEMQTFVVSKTGKPEADTGAHDDRVMAMAITQHVRNMRATRPLRIAGSAPAQKKRAQRTLATRAPRLK